MTATNDNLFGINHNKSKAEPKFLELEKKIDLIAQNIEILLENSNHAVDITSNNMSDRKRPAVRALDLYGNRRRRAKLFGADLFREPAWDILLDLFIATETGKQISVTSACIGAAVPSTTALRWLAMLETRGLILRQNDDRDARRSYVRLSDLGKELMHRYLTDA